MKKFKFIDLFCGLGGFRLALESLGGTCVFSSDIDSHIKEVYKNNFGEYPFGDISQINPKDIPDHDILCAGFPCQPFSIAGKRLGFNDSRGTLFFEIAKIAKEKRPKVLFLENVAGIINHDSGKTLKVLYSVLDDLDYSLSWKTMNAKDYGVPQNRNRWYGIALRKDLGAKFEFPPECALNYTLEDIVKKPKEQALYTMSQTAQYNINKFLDVFKKSHRYTEGNVLIANEIRASRCNFRMDNISPCLTAKMGTGGNNVPVLVKDYRKLTEKECLLIMGFPKTYKIPQNTMQSYKQIGNSVAVPVIKMIAQNILKTSIF